MDKIEIAHGYFVLRGETGVQMQRATEIAAESMCNALTCAYCCAHV